MPTLLPLVGRIAMLIPLRSWFGYVGRQRIIVMALMLITTSLFWFRTSA